MNKTLSPITTIMSAAGTLVPALGVDLRNGYIADGRGGRMTVAEWGQYKKREHERIEQYQKREQGK